MATVGRYDSSSITTLFSSLNNSKSSNSIFGSIDLGQYASIRSGSYKKLLTAYYAKQSSTTSDTSSTTVKTDSVSDKKLNAAKVRDAAAGIVDAQKSLDQESLWQKKTTTDSSGNTKTDYDTDAIYKAVSEYVKDYNSFVGATASSSESSVLTTGSSIVGYTKANSKLLAEVGITIGSDNKLSVSESTFKSADMSTVKSLFDGVGSYGKTVASSAASAYSSAVSQLASLNSSSAYSSSGSYSYISGSVYDTFL